MKSFFKNKPLVIVTLIFTILIIGLTTFGTLTIYKLVGRVNELSDYVTSNDENIKQTNMDFDEYINSLEEDLSGVFTSLDITTSLLNELEDSIDELEKSSNDKLNEQKTNILNELKTAKDSLNEKVTSLVSEITNLKSIDTSLEGKITTVSESVKTLNSTLTSLKTLVDKNSNDITTLNNLFTNLDSLVLANKTGINGLAAELDSLESLVAAEKNRLDSTILLLENLKIEFGENLTELESSILDTLDLTVESINDTIESLETSIASQLASLDANYNSSIDLINDTLLSLLSNDLAQDNLLGNLIQNVENLNRENINLISEINILIQRINCLEGIHIADVTKEIQYEWADDYSSVKANAHCSFCDSDFVETTLPTYSDGYTKGDFRSTGLYSERMVILGTHLSGSEIGSEIFNEIKKGNYDLVVQLPKEVDPMDLYAMKSSFFDYEGEAVLNLTLKGIEILPDYAFENSSNSLSNFLPLKSLYLPDVVIVGNSAFNGCVNLVSINAPKLEVIGEEAFWGLNDIEEGYFPNLNTINSYSFANTSFKKLVFNSVITSIHENSFLNTDTTQLDLVVSIDQKNFELQDNQMVLNDTYVARDNNTEFCGYTFKSITSSLGVPYILDTSNMSESELQQAIENAESRYINIILSSEIDEGYFNSIINGLSSFEDSSVYLVLSGLTKINDNTFNIDFVNSIPSVKALYLPDVTDIGKSSLTAFTNITHLEAPVVKYINEKACINLVNLETIEITNVKEIDSYAFKGCISLKKVSIPNATNVFVESFSDSGLESIYMPEVYGVSGSAFKNTKLKEITLNSIANIYNNAFENIVTLEKVVFTSSVYHFGCNIFKGIDTTKVDLVIFVNQKNFTGSNDTSWTRTEEAAPTGENQVFIGYTFKSITIG